MSDSSASSYIHMVQHLIEKCILFNMSKEECMEALSKHANILPLITSVVWKELEKENMEVFEAYYKKLKILEVENAQENTTTHHQLDNLGEIIHKLDLDSTADRNP